MNKHHLFLSCDWGTSSFRLRLIHKTNFQIIAEQSNANGNAKVFQQWQNEENPTTFRLAFYQSFILQSIQQFEQKTNLSLKEVPLIISGMASSTIGMLELPYKKLPFSLSGSDLKIEKIAASTAFPYPTTLVSGVKSDSEVMRGEEIQLVGGAANTHIEKQVFIIPGTHCKHIFTQFDKAISFATYMTGELFQLLSTQSILTNSIEKSGDFTEKAHKKGFEKGLLDSLDNNPLNVFFRVRTNSLFEKCTKQENFYYLSGLLIGLELKELMPQKDLKVTLISNDILTPQYFTALNRLKIGKSLNVISVDKAIINGHYKILQHDYETKFLQ